MLKPMKTLVLVAIPSQKKQVFQISLKIAPLDKHFRDDFKYVQGHMFFLSRSKVMLKFSIKKLIKYS